MDRLTVKRGTLLLLGMKAMGIKGVYSNERCFPFNSDRNSKKTKESKAKFEKLIILYISISLISKYNYCI